MIEKGLLGGGYKPLSQEAIEKVHQVSLKVIEQVGVQVNSKSGVGLFKQAGAQVDEEKLLVKMSPERVMDLIR